MNKKTDFTHTPKLNPSEEKDIINYLYIYINESMS